MSAADVISRPGGDHPLRCTGRSPSKEKWDSHICSEEAGSLRSQIVTLKGGRGTHRKYLPYVFTEQGVAMLSSILRSERAIRVNIDIMRAFVSLRGLLASNNELAGKLAVLERKYDSQFKVVFAAIRALMIPPEQKKKKPIGFAPWE
jgi:hypothetical protein